MSLIINPSKNSTKSSSQEDLGDFKFSVTSKLDIDDINNKKREVMQIFKNMKVPGNRPGKASDQAIMMHHKDRFNDTLIKALAEQAYHDAIAEQKLKPIGYPKFKTLDLSPLQSEFTCVFEILNQPNFDLPDFKTWDIVKPAQEDHDTVIEQQVQLAREQAAQLSPFEEKDVVEPGDSIVVNLEFLSDGVRVDSMCAEGQVLEVDRILNPDNFGIFLLGMKPGETKTFDFPGSGFFEGKKMTSTVEFINGSKKYLPELNDELAKKYGCEDLSDLRQKISSAINANQQKVESQKLIEAIKVKIKNSFTFKVPQFLVEGEAKMLSQKVGEWDKLEDMIKEGLKTQATDNLRFSFVMNKVAETFPECELGDMEAVNYLEHVLRQQKSGNEAEAKLELEKLKQSNQLSIIVTRLKEEFAIEKMLSKVNIIEN